MYLKQSDFIEASSNASNASSDISEANLADEESGEEFWIAIDSLLFIAIFFGNILTILAVAITRRLKTVVSNYFVVNLAVSDLMVGISLMYNLAFYVDSALSHNQLICVSRFVLLNVACGGSIYNLILIAIDRYISIVHPLSYNAYATRRRVLLIITITWICTIGLSSILIYWNRFDDSSTCELETVLPRCYVLGIQMPSFFLTCVTMFLIYWKIWREAQMCARRMNHTGIPNIYEKNDSKGVQVVLLILGCFSICWFPYFIVACIRSFDWNSKSTEIWYKATFALAVANSGMNPLIYAWKNTNFRSAFLKILRLKSPNNKLDSSLKMYLEKQRELRKKQNGKENDYGVNGNNTLHGYSSDRQSNHSPEENRMENTIL